MTKIKFMICTLFASMAMTAFTACNAIEDDPVVPTTVELDDPQEEVTDQPASSRGL